MPVTIRNAGVVNRVYPNFFDDFEKLGGVIER
jgi:5-enolpyruvylshikimate-3-phosphate synthase